MDIIQYTASASRQLFDENINLVARAKNSHMLDPYQGALHNYVNSRKGQEQLRELNELHSRVPMTHRLELKPEDISHEHPGWQEALEQRNKELSTRNPRKLAIAFEWLTPGTRATPQQLASGYSEGAHEITLKLPHVVYSPEAARDAVTGESVFRAETLEEVLTHEIEHVLQSLRRKYANGPNLSLPCREAKAVAAERDYTMELNAQLPISQRRSLRQLYVDTEATLKKNLDDAAQGTYTFYNILRKAHIPHKVRGMLTNDLSKEQLVPTIEEVGKGVFFDAGCSNLANDELIKRTRTIMINGGLSTSAIQDADILQYIHRGIKRELEKRGIREP